MSVETRKFSVNGGINLEDIVTQITSYLRRTKAMETQYAAIGGGFIVQAAEGIIFENSNSRPAISARFLSDGETLSVTIGEGFWSRRLSETEIGWFLALSPLVRAEYGSTIPNGLKDDIFDAVEKLLNGESIDDASAAIDDGDITISEVAPAQESYEDVAMIICSNCGTENKAAANFCKRCGARMRNTCPFCGSKLVPGSAFCMECGTRI